MGKMTEGPGAGNTWLRGKMCSVCGNSCAACYTAKKQAEAVEPKGYQLETADEEDEADQIAKLMTELAAVKAAAEQMDCKVFCEGSQEARDKWYNGAKEEMVGMHGKNVLVEVSRDNLREELGLKPDEKIPKPLPTKLVATRKPDEGAELSASEAGLGEPPWKAEVRHCACGNFEAEYGSEAEASTQNVSPEALRIMAHELSAHKDWIGAAGDVSLAFLNSRLDEKDVVLLEPPSALKRLGLARPHVLWRARQHI